MPPMHAYIIKQFHRQMVHNDYPYNMVNYIYGQESHPKCVPLDDIHNAHL
jgi:hypothetical protein